MTKHKGRRRKAPERRELGLEKLQGIIERARVAPLGEADYATLKAAVETLAFLTEELAAKRTSLERLPALAPV